MAVLDSQLSFVPVGANQSMVAGAGVNIASQVTLDVMGVGVGVAPPNIFGTPTLFGANAGVGRITPFIDVAAGVAFTTANSATLNIALQCAADTGAAGNYQPSTWFTIIESGAIAVAYLTAATRIWRPEFQPQNVLQVARPRFYRLLFQVASATNFTAGTIAQAVVTLGRDDQDQKYAAKNFVVA